MSEASIMKRLMRLTGVLSVESFVKLTRRAPVPWPGYESYTLTLIMRVEQETSQPDLQDELKELLRGVFPRVEDFSFKAHPKPMERRHKSGVEYSLYSTVWEKVME